MSKENKEVPTPEQFTDTVSPTREGIKQRIKDVGLIRYVHQWLDRYASLVSASKDTTINAQAERIKELEEKVKNFELFVEILKTEKHPNNLNNPDARLPEK